VRVIRAFMTGGVAVAMLLVAVAAPSGAADVTKVCTALDGLQEDISAAGLQTSDAFDGHVFTVVGKAFAKAAKKAPKGVRSSLKTLAKYYKSFGKAKNPVEIGQAIGKNAKKFSKASADFAQFVVTECAGTSSSGSSSSSGGAKAGSLVLGGETISLDRSQCLLKEQTSAGQKIELTAQGHGTNADGTAVTLDFTRYARGEQFEGDDITIDIGNPTSSDLTTYRVSLDYGVVDRSGSTLSVSGVEARNFDAGQTASVSFDIDC
jgi:hypothetical protein